MRRPDSGNLLTQAQLGDQGTIALDVLLGQIVQHLAALTDHLQQTTTGVVVVGMHAQVIGQLLDAGDDVIYRNSSDFHRPNDGYR